MAYKKLSFKKLDNVVNPKSIHGIYPYRGKISAVDAKQLISQFPKTGILLDPFCGSGTIIYEAKRHGMNVIGVDNNPIATQISKAKLAHVDIDSSLEKINNIVEKIDLSSFIQMPENASKYFHDNTANQIMHLKEHYDVFSDYEKGCFLGAICLAARGCNNYKWSSTQIGSISDEKKNIDFHSKFKMKLKKHNFPISSNGSLVIQGDTRKISEYVEKGSVNYVYTSPPYFDALDYTSNYTRIIHNIFENDYLTIKKNLIQNYKSYEKDMKSCFDEIKKVTAPDAIIVFVVGNKKRGKKIINGGDFFEEIIDEKPSYILEREYTGTASKIWDKINNTTRKEQIVVWDKSEW
ncbi:DNA adenine methylase [Methanolobus halotolerans]|uniref:Site-specific DNA-methyltransferase (cytosine-N(4)-specific) n=1 Tax=Methanolobus halotolerans TaxID=2052935 RepID=A0A4E0Q2I9_9EURY|nr:DNA adenine methylase [Methanolobus halotolerans]TGC07015.1 hypothetical protein CUN85_12025 [Methanolobus halotolerans]